MMNPLELLIQRWIKGFLITFEISVGLGLMKVLMFPGIPWWVVFLLFTMYVGISMILSLIFVIMLSRLWR